MNKNHDLASSLALFNPLCRKYLIISLHLTIEYRKLAGCEVYRLIGTQPRYSLEIIDIFSMKLMLEHRVQPLRLLFCDLGRNIFGFLSIRKSKAEESKNIWKQELFFNIQLELYDDILFQNRSQLILQFRLNLLHPSCNL